MLKVDPKKRMTPREFLQSDWIMNSDQDKCDHHHGEFLSEKIVRRMSTYRGQSVLKQHLMHILVLQLDSKETAELRHEF